MGTGKILCVCLVSRMGKINGGFKFQGEAKKCATSTPTSHGLGGRRAIICMTPPPLFRDTTAVSRVDIPPPMPLSSFTYLSGPGGFRSDELLISCGLVSGERNDVISFPDGGLRLFTWTSPSADGAGEAPSNKINTTAVCRQLSRGRECERQRRECRSHSLAPPSHVGKNLPITYRRSALG